MDTSKSLPYHLLEETVEIPVEILSNKFKEISGYEGTVNSYQEIVLQVKEEEPDLFAIGVLYTISLMSFSFATPRGISEEYFIPEEQWNLGYFIQGLEFRDKSLCFSSDYVSGRLMKTEIIFESGGRVTLIPSTGEGVLRGSLWICKANGILA